MRALSLTFAVGDIHGCHAKLEKMLAAIQSTHPSGKVVFLGDYVDRGPDSAAVVARLMSGPPSGWEWITLKGNHEDMMEVCIEGREPVEWWVGNGGAETLVSFGGTVSEASLEWVRGLPTIYTDEHRVFVHAGVDETRPLEEQTEQDLMWKRVPEFYSGTYWGKHLCHGHTPSLKNPRTVGNRTNVDSGAVFGGALSCAVFDDSISGGPIDIISV